MRFTGLSARCVRLIPLMCATCCLLSLATLPMNAQDVIGDVYASDASVRGSVVLAGGGTRVLSGSTVSAGLSAATVKLARGGTLRVCPGTNASLSSAQSGRALAMGFNSGAMELHYDLAASADTVQTSDFRLLLAGPGTFHLAVASDQLGNTCVKPMAQNTSSVIVQELFGDGSYQVKADEAVVFRKGRVANLSRDVPPDCGCPVLPEVKRAEASPPAPAPGASTQRRGDAAPTPADVPTCKVDSAPNEAKTPGCGEPQPTTLAAMMPGAEVESPFVFRADPAVPDPPVIANVRLSDRGKLLVFQPVVLPPPGTKVAASNREAAKPQPPKNFMARVRSFFSGLFK